MFHIDQEGKTIQVQMHSFSGQSSRSERTSSLIEELTVSLAHTKNREFNEATKALPT